MLTATQAGEAFRRTIWPKHKQELTAPLKPQKTTSARSSASVKGQYRWDKMVTNAFAFLQAQNVPDGTDASFLTVSEHFIVNGDEASFAANDDFIRVIGDAERKQHERNSSNSRATVTVFRTGNAAGNQGPTIFMMKGKVRSLLLSLLALTAARCRGSGPGTTTASSSATVCRAAPPPS